MVSRLHEYDCLETKSVALHSIFNVFIHKTNLFVYVSGPADVLPVGTDETAETLWGDKPDPKMSLEANGFQMRRVVLTPRRRR